MDGTRNSTDPPAPTSSSAILSEVKVLPVPQAMMSLPRSCARKPSNTSMRAACWCGRRAFLPVETSTSGVAHEYCDQSKADSSSQAMSTRCTGTAWWARVSDAFGDHDLAVSKM